MLREAFDKEHPLSFAGIDGQREEAVVYSNPLDDVFGDDDTAEDLSSRQAGADDVQTEHPSRRPHDADAAKLRITHTTNGYRDGLSESKPQFVQEGFDEGYALGAVLGFRAAWLLRALEGIIFSRSLEQSNDGSDTRLEILRLAKTELSLQALLSQDYFDQNAIWKYEVSGAEAGLDFDQVSRAHPMLEKWLPIVVAEAEAAGLSTGLSLTPFTTHRHAPT